MFITSVLLNKRIWKIFSRFEVNIEKNWEKTFVRIRGEAHPKPNFMKIGDEPKRQVCNIDSSSHKGNTREAINFPFFFHSYDFGIRISGLKSKLAPRGGLSQLMGPRNRLVADFFPCYLQVDNTVGCASTSSPWNCAQRSRAPSETWDKSWVFPTPFLHARKKHLSAGAITHQSKSPDQQHLTRPIQNPFHGSGSTSRKIKHPSSTDLTWFPTRLK